MVSTALAPVKNVISEIVNDIKATVRKVIDGIKNQVSDTVLNIQTVISNIIGGIKQNFQMFFDNIKSVFENIKTAVAGIFEGIKTTISGVFQVIVKKKEFGVYVNDQKDVTEGSILLPAKQVPDGARIGDQISCFVYKDSEDRPIATVHIPKITLGAIRPLRVKEVSKIGAFLDWGLEKDLFLPFKEQLGHIRPNKEYLVSLYIDKSDRLCATMKIGKLLSTDHHFKVNDWVHATVYNINPDHGAFVAVEDQFLGRIPKREIHNKIVIGEQLNLRVTKVNEDGKLSLSPHEKAYLQIDRDAKLIMDTIESYDGRLPFNDKARPATIERELGLSKAAFKRAVGRLLKDGLITITDNGILKK